jgi:hypothetical protein
VPPLIVTAPLPLIGPENMPPLLIANAVGFRFTVPLPLSVAIVCAAFVKLVVPLLFRFVVEEMAAPESTVRLAPGETLTLVLAIDPGDAISSVPPLIVTAPLPLIGPENVPPPLIVSAVGFRFSAPLPLSVAIVCAVFVKLVVPLLVRFAVEEIAAPESTVRLAPKETLMLVLAIEPGEAISSEPPVTPVAPL